MITNEHKKAFQLAEEKFQILVQDIATLRTSIALGDESEIGKKFDLA